MKKIAITTFVVSTMALVSGCGSSNGNTPGGADADPISIVTVEGAQHVLTGAHATECYASDGGGRIDRLTITGTEWTNESDLYADDTCSTGIPNRTGKLIGNISKVDDILISGWRGQGDVAPQRADGTGSLSNNEVVTPFNIEITAVIDPTQVFGGGLSIGFQTTAFYVFDDTAGAGTYIMYRDDDGAFASASDPYVLNVNAGGTSFTLPSIANSGATIELSGKTWASGCYVNGSVDSDVTLSFSGTVSTSVQNVYSSNDGTCNNITSTFNVVGDLTADNTTGVIVGWADSFGTSASAPQKQDGSGALTNTESYTQYTLTVTSTDIPGISVGDAFAGTGYIVDDSGVAVLYNVSSSGEGGDTGVVTAPLFLPAQ